MRSLKELLKQNPSLANDERALTMLVYEEESGLSFPMRPFEAEIVGIAAPPLGMREREIPNAALKSPAPPCTDVAGLDECFNSNYTGTPDELGFYPPEVLPCGITPIRYRWISRTLGITSNGCGWRTVNGNQQPWRQAFYAVNVAHGGSDIEIESRMIDYQPVAVGVPVIMAFGNIEKVTGGEPKWGFFFTHRQDANGLGICRRTGGTGQHPWCCYYIQNNIVQCTTVPGPTMNDALAQCAAIGQLQSVSDNGGNGCFC